MKRLMIAGLSAAALLTGGAIALNQSGDSVAHARADAKSTVDAAKARGEVGERIDGYLGVVSSASADVRAAVDEINIGRKTVYRNLARDQNVEIKVVARLTGEKLIAQAPGGQYIMDDTGSWSRK